MLPTDAEPLGQPDRLQAALAGSLRASRSGGRLPQTLGITIPDRFDMNQLCFLTNLSSSDVAAWAQAIVSSVAIIVGAWVVSWQTHRTRLAQNEREAHTLAGLALLISHLKEAAHEARAEKKKLRLLPLGHPAEPSYRFQQLIEVIHRFPLETIHGAIPMDALLTSQRVGKELLPYVGPEPELDVNPANDQTFTKYIEVFDRQVAALEAEGRRLMSGK